MSLATHYPKLVLSWRGEVLHVSPVCGQACHSRLFSRDPRRVDCRRCQKTAVWRRALAEWAKGLRASA